MWREPATRNQNTRAVVGTGRCSERRAGACVSKPAVDQAPEIHGGEAGGNGKEQVHDQQRREQRTAAGR